MTREEAYNKAKEYFLKYYRKDINELTITNVKGYWLDEITGLTYYCAEHNVRDKYGRYTKAYRIWEALHK